MSDPQAIESFVSVTDTQRALAEQYLSRNNGDIGAAIEDFYNTNGNLKSDTTRLKPSRAGGIRTLRDLDTDEDGEDDRTDANFFTGGEKLALQVENPDKDKKKPHQPSLVERIFQRASEQMNEEDDRPSATAAGADTPARNFTGTGFRLGDSNLALEVIEDRSFPARQRPAKVTREITFWRQGFTVGEGPLRRYDDEENVLLLQELKQGRVPVSLLDVEFGQDVDVSVVRKVDEDYVPPKRKIAGFQGQGHRLGSPVPGEELSAGTAPETTASPSSKPAEKQERNLEGEGDSLVQIRFANGKRVSRKFNGLDPITTVYAFVRDHEYTDQLKPFILSHTFPVKPIEESAETTVELAKLKNAVIVQRWKQ